MASKQDTIAGILIATLTFLLVGQAFWLNRLQEQVDNISKVSVLEAADGTHYASHRIFPAETKAGSPYKQYTISYVNVNEFQEWQRRDRRLKATVFGDIRGAEDLI